MNNLISTLLVTISLTSGCTSIITTLSDQPVTETKTNRSFGERIDDRVLRSKAMINLSAEPSLKDTNIEVYSHEGQILLIGQVPEVSLLAAAENAIKPLRDLRRFKNLLSVGKNTSFLRAIKDTLIAGKLRTKLLLNNENSIGNIKLAVENSEVYLYGLANRVQAELATNLAKETAGVKTVIIAVSYVD